MSDAKQIEVVAKALLAANGRLFQFTPKAWLKCQDATRDHYRALARAAIKAMKASKP